MLKTLTRWKLLTPFQSRTWNNPVRIRTEYWMNVLYLVDKNVKSPSMGRQPLAYKPVALMLSGKLSTYYSCIH